MGGKRSDDILRLPYRDDGTLGSAPGDTLERVVQMGHHVICAQIVDTHGSSVQRMVDWRSACSLCAVTGGLAEQRSTSAGGLPAGPDQGDAVEWRASLHQKAHTDPLYARAFASWALRGGERGGNVSA